MGRRHQRMEGPFVKWSCPCNIMCASAHAGWTSRKKQCRQQPPSRKRIRLHARSDRRKSKADDAMAAPATRTATRPQGQRSKGQRRSRSSGAAPSRRQSRWHRSSHSRLRQFRAVRVAMENRKKRPPSPRRSTTSAARPRPRPARRAYPRQRNALFHIRNRHPRMPSAPPSAITTGKTTGSNHIAGAPEIHRAPQSDCHHRHDVIETPQRMKVRSKTRRDAPGLSMRTGGVGQHKSTHVVEKMGMVGSRGGRLGFIRRAR